MAEVKVKAAPDNGGDIFAFVKFETVNVGVTNMLSGLGDTKEGTSQIATFFEVKTTQRFNHGKVGQ